MLNTAVSVSHVLLAAALIGLILLQRGKGAEAGAAFGAGASGTVFGAAGSGSFLTRLTGVLATLFFVTSLSLAYLSGKQTGPTSVVEQAIESEVAVQEDAELLPLPDADLPALPDELPAMPELTLPEEVPEQAGQEPPQ